MKYLKGFLLRGLCFGGFGPVIMGIIYYFISVSLKDFSLSGKEVLVGILSTYFLAFIHAGASIFNQIEGWSCGKSMAVHLSVLYTVYVICYLVNSWIPFDWKVIGIFTLIFIGAYLIVWLTVYVIVNKTSKNLNNKLKSN